MMIVGYAVSVERRLMSIRGWRRLDAPTLRPEEALPRLLAGETVYLQETDLRVVHRLWWEGRRERGE